MSVWGSLHRATTSSILKPRVSQLNSNSFKMNTAGKYYSSSSSIGRETSAEDDLVVVEKLQMIHNITMIAINRPEKRNCVNHATALKLEEAIRQFEDDPTSSAAVLYGKGGNFCAGYDLEEVSGAGNDESSLNFINSDNFNPSNEKGLGPMGPSRRFFKKPIIAAVAGYAVAGGLELALMCDARVVEETAVMGVFCRRFGVPLIDGGTVRLPHLIGLSRAMDLILTGRPVKAKEALEIGLANQLVGCGTAVGQAVQYANNISKFPQECLNRDRLSAYNAMYSAKSFEDAVKFEMENGLTVMQSESVGGAKKFTEGVGRHGSFNIDGLKSLRHKNESTDHEGEWHHKSKL